MNIEKIKAAALEYQEAALPFQMHCSEILELITLLEAAERDAERYRNLVDEAREYLWAMEAFSAHDLARLCDEAMKEQA